MIPDLIYDSLFSYDTNKMTMHSPHSVFKYVIPWKLVCFPQMLKYGTMGICDELAIFSIMMIDR